TIRTRAPAPAAFGLGVSDENRGDQDQRQADRNQPEPQSIIAHEIGGEYHADGQQSTRNREQPALPGVWRGAITEAFLPEPVTRHRYAAVPPTVRPSRRKVGWPTPTGTLWPFLPQVPMPVSSFMSLPIMLTRVSDSGPEPIRVAPLMAGPSLPSSIR